MSVKCFIEQKDGTRYHFEAGCFGWMDLFSSLTLSQKAPKSNYAEVGAKVGYSLYYTATLASRKYLKHLQDAKLLKDVVVTTQESDERAPKGRIKLEAVCSNELPGQEIVGKFELLRHLEVPYYKTLVDLVEELALHKAANSRYNHLTCLIADHSPIVIAMYITRWFRVTTTCGLPDCMPAFPSRSFLRLANNCEQSRQVYKGWKDSGAFSGVYRYFSNGLLQDMTAAQHYTDPLILKNPEDIKYTFLSKLVDTIPLSTKDAVRVFEVNSANITRY